jgi:anti-sigma B factor antagonist
LRGDRTDLDDAGAELSDDATIPASSAIRTEYVSDGATPVAIITFDVESVFTPVLAEELDRRMSEALTRMGDVPGALLLDVSRVKYVAAVVIGVVLRQHKHATHKGIDLQICGANGSLLQFLSLTRVDRLLKLLPDREAALKALGH